MGVNFSVKDKVAIVTGGSKGIGRAIAITLAEHGADLAIAARGREALEKTRSEIEATGRRCIAFTADMADEKEWHRLVDETIAALGGVDILVNNAATASAYGPIAKDRQCQLGPGDEGEPEGAVHPLQPVPPFDESSWRRLGHTHHLQ
jgi:NAD(P)-dependent dehydrogenase (short-subunit alcohol dehydrogenase family)